MPFGVPYRPVPLQPLSEETKEEVGQQRGVDANRQPAEPVANNKSVDVVGAELWPELVDDVEGNRNK